MKRGIILLLSTVILIANSCSRDHLHYETSRYALIHIEIDWETLSHITPNGVSAYIFDSNGDKYSDVILSSDPNNVYFSLPEGDYSVVFHNNSISELSGVHLIGADHIDTFSIHANEASYTPEFEALDEEIFVDQPDDVVSYTMHDLHVSSADVNYHYDKPDLVNYEQEVSLKYTIQPDHIVHVARIIAYLDGVEYSSTKNPMTVLHGMSGGYYFGAECTSEEDVMEEFEATISSTATIYNGATRTNGVVDMLDEDEDGYTEAEISGMGMVYVDFNTFGMHITDADEQHYFLYIRFYLHDGTYTDYEVDITDCIKTEDTGTNNEHTVELILTPLPEGDQEPGDGTWGDDSTGGDEGSDGTFDPSLDEWVDTTVELPM